MAVRSDEAYPVQVSECWHLTAEDHSQLAADCLLPLARLQARAALAAPAVLQASDSAPSSQPAVPAPPGLQGQPPAHHSGGGAAHKWAAPQLSQLVDRLGSHAAATTSGLASASGAPLHQRSRLAVLAPAQAAGEGGDGGNAARNDGCAPAAVPARVLLACLARPPRAVLTAQPLLFANAEAPMREPDQEPLAAPPRDLDIDAPSPSSSAGGGADAENPRAAEGGGAPDFLDRARSVAQRLTSRGRKGAGAQPRAWKSAVADASTIHAHIAALIQVCPPPPP